MKHSRDTVPPEEIALRLDLGINQVYAGLRKGQIPARRIGRRWIVTRPAFEQWLAGVPQSERAA